MRVETIAVGGSTTVLSQGSEVVTPIFKRRFKRGRR